jgi:hypothetical protein
VESEKDGEINRRMEKIEMGFRGMGLVVRVRRRGENENCNAL